MKTIFIKDFSEFTALVHNKVHLENFNVMYVEEINEKNNEFYTLFAINESGMVIQIEIKPKVNDKEINGYREFELYTYTENLKPLFINDDNLRLQLLEKMVKDVYEIYSCDDHKLPCLCDVIKNNNTQYFDPSIWFYLYIVLNKDIIIHKNDFALFPYMSMNENNNFDDKMFEFLIYVKEENKSIYQINYDKVGNWGEFCEKHHSTIGYKFDDDTLKVIETQDPTYHTDQLTKEDAQAFMAMGMLMKLRRDWVGEWKWWEDENEIFYVISYNRYEEKIEINIAHFLGQFLTFPTKEMANEFFDKFYSLLEKCKYYL
jgi:hypothetical protein